MNQTKPRGQVRLRNGTVVRRASHRKRAKARLIDTACILATGWMIFLAVIVARLGLCGVAELECGEDAPVIVGGLMMITDLGILTMLMAAVSYEPYRTARRIFTIGKERAGIRVVTFRDGSPPSMRASLVRWAIPAGLGLLLCSLAVLPLVEPILARGPIGLGGFFPGALLWQLTGGAPFAWLLLHMTALSSTGRTLQDIMAGTIVIEASATSKCSTIENCDFSIPSCGDQHKQQGYIPSPISDKQRLSEQAQPAESRGRIRIESGSVVNAASHITRAGARAMDIVPVVAVGMFLHTVAALVLIEDCLMSDCESQPWLLSIASILTLAFALWYEPFRIARTGNTFGKDLAGIEIVSIADGHRPSTRASFLRWAIPAGLSLTFWIALGALLMYGGILHGNIALGAVWYWAMSGCGTVGWLLLHLLTAINGARRGLADRLAGTVVVESQPPKPDQPQAPPQQAQH